MGVKVISEKTKSFIVHDGYKGDEAVTASVKAGSVFIKDGKAVGVVLNDVDVEDEARTVGVMFDGWVNPDLLDDTPENINRLQTESAIKFRFYEGSAFGGSSAQSTPTTPTQGGNK